MNDPPQIPVTVGLPVLEPLPAEAAGAPGVAFNPPPLWLLPQVMNKIEEAVATIPEGKSGGLASIFEVTPEGVKRVNAVAVQKIDGPGPFSFEVTAWIGKEWGGPRPGLSYGVAWRTTW